MRILVTGANGFIGRAFCATASQRGHDVLRLMRRLPGPDAGEQQAVLGTLDDAPWPAIKGFGADAVLHLAWVTTPGVYLTSPENRTLLQQSERFLRGCLDAGIPHLAAAGSCVEYSRSEAPMAEWGTALDTSFPYSAAKVALYRWLEAELASAEQAWTWFRIFYPYGPGEHPQRLTSYLIRQLASGQPVILRTPNSVKDYVYIDDLVEAICVGLEQRLRGPVNVGSGTGLRIRALAERIARTLEVSESLIAEAEVPQEDPWPVQVATMSRLDALGWSPKTSLANGLRLLIESMMAVPMTVRSVTGGA